jgi:hypothetical protein
MSDEITILLWIIIGAFGAAIGYAILHAVIKSAIRAVMREHHEWLEGWEESKRPEL